MYLTDPIADMLTRIRNGLGANHETVSIPYSRTKSEIARILKDEGFITSYSVDGETPTTKTINVVLKYGHNNQKVISGIKRISKPGLRVYTSSEKLPRVLNGLGVAIISTSKGLMTDREARKNHVGGEILAYVW